MTVTATTTSSSARAPGIAWLGLLLLLVACGSEPGAIPEGEGPPDGPTQITYDYRTIQTRDGVMQWELHGNTAYRFPGSTSIELEGVRMRFYEEGALKAVLTSQTGEIDEDTRDTVARGDVQLLTQDGKTLHSEELHWANERRRVHTEAFVRYTEGDQILTGYGLETDPDLTDLTLRERVVGEVPGEKRPEAAREQP